jgi:hypothetical protein
MADSQDPFPLGTKLTNPYAGWPVAMFIDGFRSRRLTAAVSGPRSNQERKKFGAPGRIRTCDARFRKPTLYPLSYWGGGPGRQPIDGPSFPVAPTFA